MKTTKTRNAFSYSWTESPLWNVEPIKKVLVFGFLFLLGWVFLIQTERLPVTDTQSQPMVFQFHGSASEWGIDSEQAHGAADQRGYLFDNEDTSSQTFTTSTIVSQPTITDAINRVSTTNKYAKRLDGPIPLEDYYVASPLVFSSDLALYYLYNFLQGDRTTVTSTEGGVTRKNCKTPWEEELVHGDFTLAYQQREDVSTICNVEKRYCNDGTLLGSYEQDHCIEDAPYDYEKVEPVSYNEKILDEYVQPGDPANKDAEFSSQGKIGEELEAITQWEDEPSSAIVVKSPSVSQTQVQYSACSAPWGYEVKNGQFVKAYKEDIGFFNRPCQVEIRICVDGLLKGNYTNQGCAYTGVSYEDYYDID